MQERSAERMDVGEPGARALNRHTFVIHVHAAGPSTLENLGTRERVAVPDLSAVGSQIERWLDGECGWRESNPHVLADTAT